MIHLPRCFALIALLAAPAMADSIEAREGWQVIATPHSFPELVDRLGTAVEAEDMVVVTQAGPTVAARARGVDIPGNQVIGVYRNDFAVRNLAASTASGIEAPIRFYVTENSDGTWPAPAGWSGFNLSA